MVKTRADGLLSALVESTIGWHYGVKKVIPSSLLVKNRFSAQIIHAIVRAGENRPCGGEGEKERHRDQNANQAKGLRP